MSKLFQSTLFMLAGILLLAACSSGPLRSFSAGDELALYDFSEARTFEEGAYPDATLRIVDGYYRIVLNQGDSEVWWAQWGDTLDDVVIDVEIEQVSERNENAYGVACRLRGQVGQEVAVDPELAAIASGERLEPEATAEMTEEATAESTEEATAESAEEATTESTEDAETTVTPAADDTDAASAEEEAEPNLANGDGYLFLIRGEGTYAILRARGRNITPLVSWTQSDVINQGPGRNELRAVCMGDYLALYVNGEFMADATDDTFSSGQIGLAASASNRLGVQVEFDNLAVHEAVSG